MTYRLKPGRPIAESVRRIGTHETSGILARFAENASEGEAVHEARKAIKRLRALLTLIRPAIAAGEYRSLQEQLRAVARSVSGLRDAQVMFATVAKLQAHDGAVASGPVAVALQEQLHARHEAAGTQVDSLVITGARKAVKEIATGFKKLTYIADGFAPLALAMKENYRKARQAMASAFEDGHDELFHEWRKLVQRHWRHLQLVSEAWPKGVQPHIVLARDLSEILGDDHDLFVLSNLVKAEGATLGGAKAVEAYLAACRKRQQALRNEAAVMGARLFAEKPSSFSGRIWVYWEHADRHGGKGKNSREDK